MSSKCSCLSPSLTCSLAFIPSPPLPYTDIHRFKATWTSQVSHAYWGDGHPHIDRAGALSLTWSPSRTDDRCHTPELTHETLRTGGAPPHTWTHTRPWSSLWPQPHTHLSHRRGSGLGSLSCCSPGLSVARELGGRHLKTSSGGGERRS